VQDKIHASTRAGREDEEIGNNIFYGVSGVNFQQGNGIVLGRSTVIFFFVFLCASGKN